MLSKQLLEYLSVTCKRKSILKRLIVIFILSLISSSAMFMYAPIVSNSVAMLEQKSFEAILPISLFVVLSIFIALLSLVNGLLQGQITRIQSPELIEKAFNKMLRAKLEGIERFQNSGEIYQRMIDSIQLSRMFLRPLISLCVGVIFITVLLFLIATINIAISAVMLGFYLGASIYFVRASGKIQVAENNLFSSSHPVTEFIFEVINKIKTIKTLAVYSRLNGKLKALLSKNVNNEYDCLRIVESLRLKMLALFDVIFLVSLAIILWFYIGSSLNVDELIVLFVYLQILISNVKSFSSSMIDLKRSVVTLEKYKEFLNIENESERSQVKIDKIVTVEFQNVSFSIEGKRILDNVSFFISQGERVSFVGPSGGGKSTIIKLMLGLYEPSSGRILINEKDVKTLDLYHYRQQISSIIQDDALFNFSISENIQLGNNKVIDNGTLVSLLEAVSLSHLIDSGEVNNRIDVKTISGGERQRLVLVRALLRNSSLMIMDEPTSALDYETEYRVSEVLKKQKITTVTIAHRLSTIKYSDKIYVVMNGKIVEEGKHSKLLSDKGAYHMLYTLGSSI